VRERPAGATFVEVHLQRNPGEAEFALGDVARVIEAVAAKHGVSLLGSAVSLPGAVRYRIESGSVSSLAAELGRHRVQYVPRSCATGRVSTAEVLVSLQGEEWETTSSAGAPVVKTYNYILNRVTRHASGHVGTIQQALSGER
jgi:protein subunit release factor A